MAELSDEQLRARVSILRDGRPDRNPDLARAKPALHPLPRLIEDYDITPPLGSPDRLSRPMVWCALCQKVNHWKGWVCETEDGAAIFLMGRDCAKRHLGSENHNKMENIYRAQADRSAALKRQAAIVPLLPAAQADIDALATNATVTAISEWRRGLKSEFSALWAKLDRAARRDVPALQKSDRVRDFSAEERERARTGENGPQRFRQQMSDEVAIPWPKLYTDTVDLDRVVKTSARWFEKASKTLSDHAGLEAMGTATIEQALSVILGVARDAAKLKTEMARMPQAFDRDHWKAIARWANRELQVGGEFKVRSGSIAWVTGWSEKSLSFPNIRKFPDTKALDRLLEQDQMAPNWQAS